MESDDRGYIGSVVLYRPLNKPVYIEAGAWTIEGRLSNFWDWRFINKDGSLGKKGQGYGDFEKIKGVKIKHTITVKLPKGIKR